ncbi:hypothetical protein CYMTET_49542 [Cymbomonas tetramitiformis]|uniref:Tubby C-terminal domain-containing protein n=1 Tax=Cymbomonas tetramitiformis TaxID=36881 RepID=A0AAE0BQ03_9CHLO|nr:hypothetical protein CYMTET_49542 [Cymbomonas tetramitiformis]
MGKGSRADIFNVTGWSDDDTTCFESGKCGIDKSHVGDAQGPREWIMDMPDPSRDLFCSVGPIRNNGMMNFDFEKVVSSSSSKRWFLEDIEYRLRVSGGTNEAILSAKKKGNCFLISAYPGSSHEKTYCATLCMNFFGTVFKLQCRWCECCEPGATPFNVTTPESERQELGAIVYENNWKGTQPRKLTLASPPMDRNQKFLVPYCPVQGHRPLDDAFINGDWRPLTVFTSKMPAWNPETKRHEACFSERVKKPSVRNFQLVHIEQPDMVMLQFGKSEKRKYALDVRHPLTPIQAFACALSSFEAGAMWT